METILYICLAIYLIGLFVSMFGSLRDGKERITIVAIGATIEVVSAIVALIVAFAMTANKHEPPKYFPESEYSLEYIVTECGGKIDTILVLTKIDTTYVLIPKEK